MSKLEQKFYDLCQDVVVKENLVLYDLDYNLKSQLLRLFIMDGKTDSCVIEDCARVDRALSPFFEEEDWIPEAIVLEVSSPGLFRQIRTKEHYEMAVGKHIKITLKKNEEMSADIKKAKNSLIGVLKDVGDENFTIEKDGDNFEFNYNQIKKVHLETQF